MKLKGEQKMDQLRYRDRAGEGKMVYRKVRAGLKVCFCPEIKGGSMARILRNLPDDAGPSARPAGPLVHTGPDGRFHFIALDHCVCEKHAYEASEAGRFRWALPRIPKNWPKRFGRC